jgi:hypothetical protein
MDKYNETENNFLLHYDGEKLLDSCSRKFNPGEEPSPGSTENLWIDPDHPGCHGDDICILYHVWERENTLLTSALEVERASLNNHVKNYNLLIKYGAFIQNLKMNKIVLTVDTALPNT